MELGELLFALGWSRDEEVRLGTVSPLCFKTFPEILLRTCRAALFLGDKPPFRGIPAPVDCREALAKDFMPVQRGSISKAVITAEGLITSAVVIEC